MKKIWKRALALLCAMAMVVGGFVTWSGQVPEAEAGTQATEWAIDGITSVGYAWQTNTAGVTLPTGVANDNLVLHVTFNLSQSIVDSLKNAGGNIRIEFGPSSSSIFAWQKTSTDIQVGNNELYLKLSEPTSVSTGLDMTSTFNRFRIWYNGGDGGAEYALTTNLTNLTAKIIKQVPSEWSVKVNNATYAYSHTTLGINFSGLKDEDLTLYVAFNINDELATYMSEKGGRVEVQFGNSSSQIFVWRLNAIDVAQKENHEYNLELSAPYSKAATVDMNATFNYFRVLYYDNVDDTPLQYVYDTLTSGMTNFEAKVLRTSPYVETYTSTVYGVGTYELEPANGNSWTRGRNGCSDLGLTFPSGITEDDVELCVTFQISDTLANEMESHSKGQLNVEFGMKTSNYGSSKFTWFTNASELRAGGNELRLPLSADYYDKLDLSSRHPSMDSTFDYIRVVYNYDGANAYTDLVNQVTDVKVAVVKPGAYVQAGKTSAEQGLSVANVPAGYVFAGWYTNRDCATKNALTGVANGTVYAKFVRGGLLSVRAQYTKVNDPTSLDSTYTNKGVIRFISTVDSLQYQEVGFALTIGTTTVEFQSTDVYESLTAVGGKTYVPTDIDPASQYFNAILFGNVPTNTPIDATVKAYWITQDGTTVYGDARTLPTITIAE